MGEKIKLEETIKAIATIKKFWASDKSCGIHMNQQM